MTGNCILERLVRIKNMDLVLILLPRKSFRVIMNIIAS